MHIIGIEHDLAYSDFIYKFLHASHPEGIESIMLELGPTSENDFFRVFEKVLRAENSNVIRGDIYHGSSVRKRNKGFSCMIEEYAPQAVLVGRGHADALKKRFPQAYYSALESESFSRFARSFPRIARVPLELWLDFSFTPKADQYVVMHQCPTWDHEDCSISSIRRIPAGSPDPLSAHQVSPTASQAP